MSLLPPLTTRSLKFETIGTTHTGKLIEIGAPQQQTEYESNAPAFWDKDTKTRPMMQIAFRLETAQRDPEDPSDDGVRKVYATINAKQGSIYHAINKALIGHDQLGGQLTVSYVGDDPESKNPRNPRKLYEAVYAPPSLGQQLADKAAASSTQTIGQVAQANSAPAPVHQPTPAPTPAPVEPPAPVVRDLSVPPDGVAPEMWGRMTDEQKQAYLLATGQG